MIDKKIRSVRISIKKHGIPTGSLAGVSQEENQKFQELMREEYQKDNYEMIITYDD